MITSDETEETLTKGFEMLKHSLTNDAFFNTTDGPLIFMTDNCDERRASIKKYGRKQRSYSVIFTFYNKYGAGCMRKSMAVFSAIFKGSFVKTIPGRFLLKSCKRNNVLATGFILSL